MTYKNWLNEWLTHYIKPASKQRTFEQYSKVAQIHILPYLGDIELGVFNQIVKIDEFESFFVDELIAHYELIISESLQKKETECRDSFESIEKSCNSFNNGAPLSPSLKTQISVFADKLKSWDNYAQPLQVNSTGKR